MHRQYVALRLRLVLVWDKSGSRDCHVLEQRLSSSIAPLLTWGSLGSSVPLIDLTHLWSARVRHLLLLILYTTVVKPITLVISQLCNNAHAYIGKQSKPTPSPNGTIFLIHLTAILF